MQDLNKAGVKKKQDGVPIFETSSHFNLDEINKIITLPIHAKKKYRCKHKRYKYHYKNCGIRKYKPGRIKSK